VRATDVIKNGLDMSDMIVESYMADLSDSDIKVIPIAGMNPIALQIGHLIASERMFVEGCKAGSCPPLPEGFDKKHNLKEGDPADGSRYTTKAEYMRLLKAQRDATRKVVDGMSDADLDAPGPEEFRKFMPTVGSALNMAGVHVLMHVGQFAAVRRHLKKPVVI
jgi:hypothetical protein